MRRLLTLVTATAIMVSGLPLMASAAPLTADEFADMCNAAPLGVVNVTGKLKVRGGAGELTQTCVVGIAPGGPVVFKDVSLSTACSAGSCGLNIGGSSGDDVTVKIIDSTLALTGNVQITAGQQEVAAFGGFLKVVRSTIAGQSVELSASIHGSDGRVVVRDSTLSAASLVTGGVLISTSTNGETKVKRTDISATGDMTIESDNGETVAKDNTFAVVGSSTITANGGSCVSSGNTPAVPCS